ncbi:pre-rRNA-processing protein Ipi1p [Trichomonascus vanleenenianus]|uniref:Ipi1p n=1 Tax=Trichomonascus vanleenenianus TaxID=2268995 RepID=UPI003ECB1D01
MVSKKAKEKRKDFQKTKLKVGKAKPLASNITNTSFVAKSIYLPQQSVAVSSTDEKDFAKHLALCKHHSATTRKEALVHIQTNMNAYHERNMKAVLNAIAPLVRDESQSVRDTLLEVLKSFSPESIIPHASILTLHVHSAMTYLQPEIRAQSTQFLDYLVNTVPEQISRQAFVKTLACFFPLLGWPLERAQDSNKPILDRSITLAASSATAGLSYGSKASSVKAMHLKSLHKLLEAALTQPEDGSGEPQGSIFHPETSKYLIPKGPSPFLSLELFVTEGNTSVTEGLEDRREAFQAQFRDSMLRGVNDAMKESGEVAGYARKIHDLINN